MSAIKLTTIRAGSRLDTTISLNYHIRIMFDISVTCVKLYSSDYMNKIKVAAQKIHLMNLPRHPGRTLKMNHPGISQYFDTLKVRYLYHVML